ncbi:site-specific integrase [Methyloversatilis sp. XJ19-49]|nr:site-specific integrase [Methyloversatilis sp. XJ19-49]
MPAASSLARVLACFQTLVAMCEEISGWDGSACGQAEGNRNPAQPAPGNARKHQAGQRPGSGLELDEVCAHTSSPLTSAVRSTAGILTFYPLIIRMDDQVISGPSDQDRMHTWKDAAERWQQETEHKKTAHEDARKLQWIGQHLDALPLRAVTADVIRTLAAARRAEGSGVSTVNRYLALVRAILRRAAFDWDWIEKPPPVRLRPEPRGRTTWLQQEQAKALFAELPEHLKAPFVFSLATGLRMSNVIRLTWDQVLIRRGILLFDGDDMKSGDPFAPALNDSALEVLRHQLGKHPRYVFTYKGRAMARASNSAWYKAKRRAGLAHLRWHDLRHTWATWHVLAGTSLDVVQDLGGWKTRIMVRRYAHLQPGAHRAQARNVDGDLAGFMESFD